MRKNEIIKAASLIQRLYKTRLCRRTFLIIRKLSIWLQSVCRRSLAKQRVHRIILSRLMNEEKYQLIRLANAEAEFLKPILSTSRILGSGFMRSGSGKFDRLLLAYDIHFDTSFSYPEGYFNPILK